MRQRADVLIPAVALAALIWLVAEGAPLIWLWWGTAALAVALLQCNPLRAFDGLLPVETRTLLIAAVVCWVAASMPLELAAKLAGASVNVLGVKIILGAVGIALAALAIYQRPQRLKEWREELEFEEQTERIVQAPQVDKVLGQLNAQRNANKNHPWNPSEAAEAWSEYGFSQTRALLHQGLDDEHHRTMCTDGLISVFCYPVWLLAWAHALKWVERLKSKFKKELEEKLEEIEQLKSKIHTMRQSMEAAEEQRRYDMMDLEGQISGHQLTLQSAGRVAAELREQLQLERERVEELENQLEALRVETPEPPVLEIVPPKLTGAELDAELLRLNREGIGYTKLAQMFGLGSKSTAQKAVNRAKAREEEAV